MLDSGALVHPYSRWLALRAPDGRLDRIPPDRLCSGVVAAGVPVGAIVFTEYAPNTATALRPLPPAQVALRLLPHCPGVRARPVETLKAVRAVAASAPGFEGPRGEAALAAHTVLRTLAV